MRVIVIGASNDRAKFGNKAVRAYQRQRHEVVPVNPHESDIEGLPSYASVHDVTGHVDRALFYVPPAIGLVVMDELGKRGNVDEIWLNPGAESEELIQRARNLGFEPILDCSIIDIGETP
jgi:uncharacterized protein